MRHSRADHPSFPRRRAGPFSRWEKVRMRVRGPVVPAYAGTSNPCLRFDVGAVREPPEGHAIPNVSPNPTTTAHCAIPAPAPTLVVCVIHAPSVRRSREGGNLESLPPVWCRGGSRTARRSRHPKRIPQPNDNCPLRHRRASPYIDHMRHSRADHPSRPRRREPRIPAPVGGVRAASLLPVWDVGAVREPPERHTIPNVPPNRRQLPITPSPHQPLH